MTLVVPFDGSLLAEAALVRATEFGIVFDEDVLAVSIIKRGTAIMPENTAGLDRTKSLIWNRLYQNCIYK